MAMATRDHLVAVEVTGDDRVSYLDDVTTQQFADLPAGAVRGLLVLDGKGAPLAMAWAAVDDDRILLLAPTAAADHLLEVVARRTFLAQASFRRLDLDTTSLAGADLDDVLAAAGLDTAMDSWRRFDDVLVVRHAFGAELVGPAAGLPELQEVSPDELALRTGMPRLGHEVVAGRLPEEYGLLPTHVHMSKGCYPGQEPIAHMWMLGRPRRRLATVTVDDGTGSDVVTGAAGGRGMAWVRPDTEVGAEVAPGVTVTGFVGANREVVGWQPDQTRRRDRDDTGALPGRRP